MSLLLGSEANEGYIERRNLVKLILKRVLNKDLTAAERALLKNWDEIWDYYEKQPETLEALQGIFYLLSNPDHKFIEFETDLSASVTSPFNRLFADPLSFREVIKIALNYIKSRRVAYPVLQTVTKGIGEQAVETSTAFDVQLAPQGINKIGFKRKKITNFKHSNLNNPAAGHVVSWTSNHYHKALPNIYQTVKAAICDGAVSPEPFSISIDDRHLRYPVFQCKQSFNIMLVLDISNSVKWILRFMDKIISMLTTQASTAKDKLGLIIFQDDRAQIIHYPTINVRHVIGSINTLSPKGKTPLADGVKLALQTLEHSRFRVTGMANAIVLLSDCFPEPITGEYMDQMDEPTCQAVLLECEKIAAANIKFLVLNPSIGSIKNYEKHLGYRLGKLAAERAGGRFLNLVADLKRTIDPNQRQYVFSEQMITKFMQEICEFRTGGA